jgi:predicted nucleotidyltransferase
MPVRSLHSSVLKWPSRQTVDAAVRRWAAAVARHPDVLRVGYFGSYARGDSGVGSDVDLIIILAGAGSGGERNFTYDVQALPVPADVLVYTAEEWNRLKRGGRFAPTLEREAVWVYARDGSVY